MKNNFMVLLLCAFCSSMFVNTGYSMNFNKFMDWYDQEQNKDNNVYGSNKVPLKQYKQSGSNNNKVQLKQYKQPVSNNNTVPLPPRVLPQYPISAQQKNNPIKQMVKKSNNDAVEVSMKEQIKQQKGSLTSVPDNVLNKEGEDQTLSEQKQQILSMFKRIKSKIQNNNINNNNVSKQPKLDINEQLVTMDNEYSSLLQEITKLGNMVKFAGNLTHGTDSETNDYEKQETLNALRQQLAQLSVVNKNVVKSIQAIKRIISCIVENK